MPDHGAAVEGEAFQKHIRIAAARYRLERLARASRPISWALAVALLIVLLLALTTPLVAWALLFILVVTGLSAATAAAIYFRRLDRHRLFVRMDAHGKLPDAVLSSGDWENAPANEPWRTAQRAGTLRLLEKIDWKQAWPVCWPQLLWLPLICSVLLAVVVGLVERNWSERTRAANLAVQQENAPVAPEQVKPLEQVFKDWDEAEKIAPSPELAELLKEIKPLRDDMAAGKMNEKELFLKLNEVQARVQAAKDKLESESLEPMAKSLADAVKDLDGMSGLSAALQRKDFAAAKEQAAQAQEKYNSGAAKMPEGDKAQTAANKLGEASKKASNDPQASSALGKMQDAASKGDGKEMSKGLGELKGSMGQQAQRQSQSHNLGTQLAQLSNAKSEMGEGKGGGIKMGLPQISLAKSMGEQKGAGSDFDPNRTGAQTQLDANHQEVKLTGTAGDGASETHTESTKDPHREQTAASVNAAKFAAYEKLSEEATQDENLPVADRQMIKRYFEDIRPKANP